MPNPEVNPTEGMLQNVDAQLNTWYVKKYMVVDSTCLTHVAETNVTPEVYKDRLRRLPTRIEMLITMWCRNISTPTQGA